MSDTRRNDPTPFAGPENNVRLDFVQFISKAYIKDGLKVTNEETLEVTKSFLSVLDPVFIAKTAIYLRTAYKVRSYSNLMAFMLFNDISGKRWAKNFYCQIAVRVEDMLEVANHFIEDMGKLPSCVKKGFSMAFERFDSNQLLKTHSINGMTVQDLINLVHPKSTRGNHVGMAVVMNNAVKIDSQTFDEEEILRKIDNIGL